MKSINGFLNKTFLSCIILSFTLSWSSGAVVAQEEIEEGNHLDTIDASTATRYTDADAHTAAGKTQWRIAFANEADGNEDYMVYGPWLQEVWPDAGVEEYEHDTGVFYHGDNPDATGSVYEREVGGFYYGDNPTTDVSSVSGTALYTGNVTGVSRSNDPLDGENHRFRGEMSMSANFDSERITGSMQNLSGEGMDGDSRFSFGADLNSAGTFSGDISYSGSTEEGTLSGGFYNPGGTNAPGHVGGGFDLDSGEWTYHGAFGGSFTPASDDN